MKYIAIIFLVGISSSLFSQKVDSFLTGKSNANLNTNNWDVRFNTSGSHGWDQVKDPKIWFPKGDSTNGLFSFALWCGGLNGKKIYTMAETYRQFGGADGQPGPLDKNGKSLADTGFVKKKWDYIYKINDHEINAIKDGKLTKDIENWPANGDLSQGESKYIAEYVDVDKDGFYDPTKGDYPKIKGNQMLYRVFNDNRSHYESGSRPMKAEIHMKGFAFNCNDDEVLKNTFFIEYQIINKSKLNYNSFMVGLWSAAELGRFSDDAMGSIKDKAGFYYNFNEKDDKYKDSIPMLSIYSVDRNLHSSIAYANDFTFQGNPRHGRSTDYYNYLQGLWKNGNPIIEDSTGISYSRTPRSDTTKFMYNGNPFDTTHWNWKKFNFRGGYVQTVNSTGPYQFNSGDTLKVLFAISGHWKYNSDPEKQYFNMIDEIDHIKNLYADGKLENACPTPLGIRSVHKNDISIFPNPTSGKLNIQTDKEIGNIRLFNSLGQIVVQENQSFIDMSSLINGFYMLEIELANGEIYMNRIIKE